MPLNGVNNAKLFILNKGVIMVIFLVLVLVFLVGLFVFGVMLFNGLVRKRNGAKNAFAQIDVQLKRRHDLIPNLVATAEKYLSHEKDTLQLVTEARNTAAKVQQSNHHTPDNDAHMNLLQKVEGLLSQAMGRFYAVAENYPELKADGVMMELMDELKNTENRIGFARQAYNDAVMFYNNAREQFPSNIIAGMFSFFHMNMLQFDNADQLKDAPKVSFSA